MPHAIQASFRPVAPFAMYRVRRTLGAWHGVRHHPLPPHLHDKLLALHAQLGTAAQVLKVEQALRQFFLASAMARGRFAAMPSKTADAMWHEFIARMLHHTPAEALAAEPHREDQNFQGPRRAWVWSCRNEGSDPRQPQRLPALFALDADLAIPGGDRA